PRRLMRLCCPPGRGCDSLKRDEPCILELCREAASEEPEAALAVARWTVWQPDAARPPKLLSERDPANPPRSHDHKRDRFGTPVPRRSAGGMFSGATRGPIPRPCRQRGSG